MDERKMLAVLIIVQALQCAAAMYFHVPSSVLIQGIEAENRTEFGFAMAYKRDIKTLVVGAPNASQIGTLFSCEIENAVAMNVISCNEQNIDYLDSDYNIDLFPKQRFHLGASIVATSDYFFTCAPLWTTKVAARKPNSPEFIVEDSFGTCFIQNDTDTYRYQGLLEQYIKYYPFKSKYNLERFSGGVGWSTLVDEENDLLLIAKSSPKIGDIYYVLASNTSIYVKSLAKDARSMYYKSLSHYWNIGFGLTAGKFFSEKTVYAFSMSEKNMEGVVSFLEYQVYKQDFQLAMIATNYSELKKGNFVSVTSHAVGAMFGNVMSSADLNFDKRDELLVGAPAQSEDECYECGALHIYLGGDMYTVNEPYRLRSIFGTKEFGRFGSAIVTKDIDGDGKLEIIVSAPYEDHGSGAIYILCGNEVYHTLMESQDFKSIQLSDLKLTQTIKKESYKTLGFSLQFIDDVDSNNCDELAAGAPGSSSVLIFKCVQKVNVSISTRLLGNQLVREQDPNFIVEVCASVQYPSLPDEIIGNITFKNSITGGAAVVLQPSIVTDISCDSCFGLTEKYCQNVTVSLNDKERGDYIFKSKIDLQNTYLTDPNMSEFNRTWVEASMYSKLDDTLVVHRRCTGDDCKSRLSVEKPLWSGSNPYLLGSSANETVTVTIKNDGNASYSACVWLKVYGAKGTVGCEAYNKGNRCYLPTPMKRETNYSIKFEVSMLKPTNFQKFVRVEVKLYENCAQEERFNTTELKVPCLLTLDGIYNEGDTHGLTITDKQILDNATVYDHHEFAIKNNGNITWHRAEFSVTMVKQPFTNSFHISTAKCNMSNVNSSFFVTYNCPLDLFANTTSLVIGTTEIIAGLLDQNKGKIEIEYNSELLLSDETDRVPDLNVIVSVTTITIQKELSWASHKWLIALIAGIFALILIAILAFILYRNGFFKRKQKQKLIVKQESERRKSVRRNTHASAMDGPTEGLEIDVVDDCPFEDARPVTAKDNVGLVQDDDI